MQSVRNMPPSGHFFHVFSRKCPEAPNLPASLSENYTEIRKMNRLWPKSNHSWTWYGYINMSNISQFVPCILQKMTKHPNLTNFAKEILGKSTNCDHTQIISGGGHGYNSLLNFRTFLQCILHKMLRNLKFNPFCQIKIAPYIRKSTNHDQNQNISECGQDTSEHWISGHSFCALSIKCLETSQTWTNLCPHQQ